MSTPSMLQRTSKPMMSEEAVVWPAMVTLPSISRTESVTFLKALLAIFRVPKTKKRPGKSKAVSAWWLFWTNRVFGSEI